MNSQSTLVRMKAGDVIEIDDVNGDTVTALVLLATSEAVIFDLCDDSMPRVAKPDEMSGVRVFRPTSA